LIVFAALLGGVYASYNDIFDPFAGVAAGDAAELDAQSEDEPEALFEATLSPTPDWQATRIVQTVDALSSIISSAPTNEPTPDMTATIAACDYDYELLEQSPANGSPYPELTTLTLQLMLENDSRCPLDDDTRLVFEEGYQLEGPDYVEFNRELLPGETIQISLNLRTPAYGGRSRPVSSVWRVLLPDGTQVGPPLTFDLDIFASPTDEP
jgi:hypothetical protein